MKKLVLPLLLGGCLLGGSASAQITDVFLKGDYVEIGTFTDGAFGTATPAPAGFHPMGTCPPGVRLNLGFVSDPDKDGWLVAAPGRSNYMGDYFVPGDPYEGWEVQVNGLKGRNWASGTAGGFMEVPTSATSFSATPTEQRGVWEGNFGNLAMTQTTVLKKDKLYFVVYVDFVNTGTTTLNNVYYHRGLDPDNEQPWAACSHNTINEIVYQPNAASKNCLVTAIGPTFGEFAFLGLGTKDCRAKCMNLPVWHPGPLNDLYNQNLTAGGNNYTVGWKTPIAGGADQAMGLVWNLGNLAPGQRTSLAFTYILKKADLDSALGETAPKFGSDGASFAPYTTFRVCPGKTVPLHIINGGQYKWIWTPGTDLAAVGTATKVPAGGTIPAITGTMTYPEGAVSGDSVEVTVWKPGTYMAMGISNCDTQRLIFYVDTLSFRTPPAVISPIRYCEGDPATALTAGAAAGATLRWYATGSGGTASGTAPTPATTMPAGAIDFDTTSYWVSQVNTAGCETPRAKIDVVITRKPAAPLTADLIYCLNAEVQPLTATGTMLQWYDAATGGSRYPRTPVPDNTVSGTTDYFVTQTINGCESDRSRLNVEISEAIARFVVSDDSLCGAEEVILTNTSASSSSGDFTSLWDLGDGTTTTVTNITHRYEDKRADYRILLFVENINKCRDTAVRTVHVFPEPEVTMIAGTDRICQGNAIDFSATATEGYTSLLWDFGDTDPAYEVLQVRHAFSQSGNFNVRFTASYPACNAVSINTPIQVTGIPKINLGNDTSFCPGSAALRLFNRNGVAERYLWSTGDTTANISVRHAGRYWLRASNATCTATDSITVSKGCYLDIPNAFTPGSGSDKDRYFLPRQLMSASVVTFDMKIFDRWGQLVFESDKHEGRGWDGRFKGEDMPLGVYVYMIRVSFANGISETYNGNLTLLR